MARGEETAALLKAVVAKGRTLVGPGKKTFGAGEEVSLPADEIGRLRGLGFLVDPEAKPVAFGNGPTFSAKDGPSVQVA